ncbi:MULTISPECIES: MFS transporter [unclassified Herbaspirillum]|jgi:predicted MFS family arabinose efflux permease|uniref:MFS transporter n=1 Tax=unclassified Herbaspirillum TaxID=2624150 RepID=UPI000E2F679B|nr:MULTISPECIES: MFS transporter [unclassified Herbaspirillum]RFB67517.1 MFS transporter [Herbaspirillum sp. 3R-3a1]TFI05122.1 MFS transporter [Herbaspirillum sp. 3R11]TFI12548.1 MFS transporter [Herbaspirillum sp. 3R-11]TFI26378.1 MFS transporter [Herbaspirillum sp. 3C11]
MDTAAALQGKQQDIAGWMITLLAAACGIIVANLYYAQPLIGPIAVATGISPGAAGLIVTLAQIGYGLGLLFIVPAGDLIENRKMVLVLMAITCVALVGAAYAQGAAQFFLAAFVIGVSSVGAQVLVPYAAHMSLPETRGRAVGNVMSGLLMGILLARPLSSLVADLFGWHAIFGISAVVTALLALVLARYLPARRPPAGMHYFALLASMWHLVRTTPILRRRSAYHAMMFAAFSLYWTTSPLFLAGPTFNMSQRGIALFAFAGVIGVIAAPIAGRVADRGWSRPATCVAMLSVAASFLMTHFWSGGRESSLAVLLASAILLDFGVSANLVLSQRAIYALGGEIRSRLNGLFMATFFGGGALGSALGGWIYAQGGWSATTWLGFAFPALALLYYFTELRTRAK